MNGWTQKVVAVACLSVAAAWAEDYPSKPVRWVVPYPAGGYADAVTRTIAPKLQLALGQPIVVDNRPGANSRLGSEYVARSAPDGYTMLSVIVGHAVNATLYADKLGYDPARSFAPVCLITIAPLILAVKAQLPARSVVELIAHAKANPGRLSYGSSGIGAGAHLTTELFRLNEDLQLLHVPYKGGAPAVQALLAGEIDILADVPSVLMPHVRLSRARALGVFAATRPAGLEEIPTMAEAGAKPIEGATWVMLVVPATTPAPIVTRLSAELRRIVASDEMRQAFARLGTLPIGSTPEEARSFLDAEIAKWKGVIERAGIKPEG